MADTLLRIENIKKFFHVKRGFPVPETVTVRAVDGVSFEVNGVGLSVWLANLVVENQL